MIKTIPLKEVRIGMCLAETVKSKTDTVIFKDHFYFTSRSQILELLDYGISEVKIDISLSLIDDRPEHEQEDIHNLALREHEDPAQIYETMLANLDETKEVYDKGEKIVGELMDSARYGKVLNQKAIREQTASILDNVLKDDLTALALLDLKNFNEYTFIHSINVAVLSVAFAYQMKFSDEKLKFIGQGSILHDIGKAKIPLDILNKPDKLNESEFKIIQRHPTLGVEVVEHEHINNEIIKEIILHHHEDFDHSGYPDKIGGSEMKKYASIVSVSDFYDALTSQRVYKDVINPPEAIKIIRGLSGKKFDPRVVNHFVRTVGIYPIGSLVELSDYRVAAVISFSKDNLLQPVVKTLFNKYNPRRPDVEIISLVHSKLYIVGDYNQSRKEKTYDLIKKNNK